VSPSRLGRDGRKPRGGLFQNRIGTLDAYNLRMVDASWHYDDSFDGRILLGY